MLQSFNEWANSKIKLSFQEKYNMLQQRLSTLQSMKLSADASLKSAAGGMVGYAVMGCGCGAYGSNDASVEQLADDVDVMWTELKKEIVSAVKEQQKAQKAKLKETKK